MGSMANQEKLRAINTELELEKMKEEEDVRPQSSLGANLAGRRKSVQFTPRPTIIFDQACKSYGKRVVLRNINITVKDSTVYGLYGKSGSGKSTAFACLLGIQSLDSGNIYVRGLKTGCKGSGIPGKRIGYMPQSTSLHEEFTMKETLHYYGKIYGMSYEDVEEKRKYFIELLQLESCKSQIRYLSEDQKQLVSFTVALLHQPEILVMDEPTINMDPLDRETVWQHVRDLAAESKTTVIVASASAIELQYAETIGILRHGKLLVEDTPSNLFSQFDTNTLEGIILKVCQQDNLEQSSQNRWNSIDVDVKDKDPGHSWVSGKTMASLLRQSSWNVGRKDLTRVRDKLLAQFLKNLLLAYRSLWLILLLLLLPAATISFVSISLTGSPTDLKFGVLNNETYMSRIDVQNTELHNGKCRSTQSCQFFKSLEEKSLNLIHFDSDTEALKSVLDGSTWGYLTISSNLVDEDGGREGEAHMSSRNFRKPFVKVILDTSNPPVATWLKKILIANIPATFSDAAVENHRQVDQKNASLVFESVFGGSGKFTLSNFIVPGVTLHVLAFYASLISALFFIQETKNGKFARVATIGVYHFDILVAHLSFMIFLLCLQTLLSFFAIVYFFNVPRVGNILLAFCLTITHGLSGIFFGVLTATVFSRGKYVVLFLMVATLPTFLISGTINPLEALPWGLKYVGYVYPGTFPGLGLKSILLRGWGLRQFEIWIAFGSTFAYSLAFLLSTYIYRLVIL